MKKLYKFALVLLVLIAIPFSIPFVKANLLSVSETEINEYLQTRLAEKVPLQDKVGIPNLFQLNYKLHNLASKVGRTPEKKVEITGTLEGVLVVKGKTYDAKIQLNMDTIPYYEPQQGAVYLKDTRLLSWSVTPEKYANELQMFLPMLNDGLTNMLNSTPVYTLDESKMKESMVKKFGKAIVIEDGSIRLETEIF